MSVGPSGGDTKGKHKVKDSVLVGYSSETVKYWNKREAHKDKQICEY